MWLFLIACTAYPPNVTRPSVVRAVFDRKSAPILPQKVLVDVVCTQLGIALAANIGGQSSPISSPQNLIAVGYMDPKLDWTSWFIVALPVSIISVILIWLLLLVSYKPARAPDGDGEIEIRTIRPTREAFTLKQWWVTVICLVTIGLWCAEHEIESTVGDMGIIAIIPIVAFFATGVLKKVWCTRGDVPSSANSSLFVPRTTLSSSRGQSYSWLWVVSRSEMASSQAGSWIAWMASFTTCSKGKGSTPLWLFFLSSFSYVPISCSVVLLTCRFARRLSRRLSVTQSPASSLSRSHSKWGKIFPASTPICSYSSRA